MSVIAKTNFESIGKKGLTKSITTTFRETRGTRRKYCKTLEDAHRAFEILGFYKDLLINAMPSRYFSDVKISDLVYYSGVDQKDRNNCKAYYFFTMSVSSKIEDKELLLDDILLDLAYRIPFITLKSFKVMNLSAYCSDLRTIKVGIRIEKLAAE